MQSNDGSLIGQAGVKYGLQKPAAIPSKARPLSVFGADSDEEEDVGAQVIRQADKKRAAAKARPLAGQTVDHAVACMHHDRCV